MREQFLLLGLQPDATLQDVKKAYARLLKQTRPEDDAIAFQRLEDAYERCIAFQKSRTTQALAQERLPDSRREGGDQDAGDGVWPHRLRSGPSSENYDIPPEPRPPHSRIVRVEPELRIKRATDGAPRHRQAPALPEPELIALLEEVITEAERQDSPQLRDWLHAHDSLVSLDVQRLVAARLPQFILDRNPKIDTERLHVIYEYFVGTEYNAGYADPRIRMTWEQAKAAEAMRRQLSWLRRQYSSGIDRLMLQEVLEPAKRGRRCMLLAIPTMTEKMSHLLATIGRYESQTATRISDPEAVDFWGNLAAPGKLPWRLIALVHTQFAFGIIALVSCAVLLGDLDWHGMWGMGLAIFMMASLVWFVLKGMEITRYRLAVWRERHLAAGTSSRDSISTASQWFAAISLALAVLQAFASGQDSALAFYSCSFAVLATALLFLTGRSRRWEILFLGLSGAIAAWNLLEISAASFLSAAAMASFAGFFGIALVLLADAWHAKKEKLPPLKAKMMVNHIAWKMTGLCAFTILLCSFGSN